MHLLIKLPKVTLIVQSCSAQNHYLAFSCYEQQLCDTVMFKGTVAVHFHLLSLFQAVIKISWSLQNACPLRPCKMSGKSKDFEVQCQGGRFTWLCCSPATPRPVIKMTFNNKHANYWTSINCISEERTIKVTDILRMVFGKSTLVK